MVMSIENALKQRTEFGLCQAQIKLSPCLFLHNNDYVGAYPVSAAMQTKKLTKNAFQTIARYGATYLLRDGDARSCVSVICFRRPFHKDDEMLRMVLSSFRITGLIRRMLAQTGRARVGKNARH